MARRKLDVKEAAQVLGISTDAVHKRAKRGSLDSDKDEDGRVFVWLDDEDTGYTESSHGVLPLIVERLESENQFLRQELERRSGELAEMRRIVAGLVQRIPALEAAPESTEAPVTFSEDAGNGMGREGQDGQHEGRRSWWRRLFEG